MERNDEIINHMVTQMGGNIFFMMTGAKPQYKKTEDNGDITIMFKLKRNKSKANYYSITYNLGSDTYTVNYIQLIKENRNIVKEMDGVYCDMLKPIFEETTGMYLSL